MIGIKTSVEGSTPDYEAIFSRFVITAAHRIRARMRDKLHEKKTGRLYSRKSGKGFGRSHQASARGEAPASDTGALERSLNVVRVNTLEADIKSALGYPAILEDPNKLDRPLWLATVDEMLPVLEHDLLQSLL